MDLDAVRGELVKPPVAPMTEPVRRSLVIHTDDTTVPAQSPGAASAKNGQCRKGRVWCYLRGDRHPYTLPTRAASFIIRRTPMSAARMLALVAEL
ncbi:MAG: hypothetical protein ACRCT8_14350 [Lacipirellulaceae bacterium]